MKNLFFISCLILGILVKASSFATQKIQNFESCAYYEKQCINEINLVRQEYGLQPLKEWKELADCARGHSQNMAEKRCPLGHDGFDKRADHMWKQAFLLSFAENVAYSYQYAQPVKVAVEGWMQSPGHQENILGDFEETGVGVSISKEGKFYITQLFVKRYKG